MIDRDSGLLILAGMAGLWFVTRFLYRPAGAKAGGLAALFRRESAENAPGIGLEALRGLVDDLTAFARAEPALRGLILAGPFAAGEADAASELTAILVSNDLSGQDEPVFLARWPYIARGHAIRDHRLARVPGGLIHHLALRGAPPVTLAFLRPDANLPVLLETALRQGARAIAIGTGDGDALLRHWDIRTNR